MQEPEIETMTNLPPWLVHFALLYDPGPPTKEWDTCSELGLPTWDASECPVEVCTNQFDRGNSSTEMTFSQVTLAYIKLKNISPHSSALLAVDGFWEEGTHHC